MKSFVYLLFFGVIKQMLTISNRNGNKFNTDKDNIESYLTEDVNQGLSEWLMISSDTFKNRQRYPLIVLPNNKEIEIQTDSQYFRNNTAICNLKDSESNKGMPNSTFYFWFRLRKNFVYYSSSKNDLNILDKIKLDSIESLNDPIEILHFYENIVFCFEILDSKQFIYKICHNNKNTILLWFCAIKKQLGLSTDDSLCEDPEHIEIIPEPEIIKQPIIIIPTPSRHCNENWNYIKNGDDWECLCKDGKQQSPISLPTKEKAIDSDKKPMIVFYEIDINNDFTKNDGIKKRNKPLSIKLKNGALKIKHPKMGKLVTLDGAVYFAQEILFHSPAEHTINDVKYPLEMQVIFYGQTKGDIAKQAILSFLIEDAPGIYNEFFDDINVYDLPTRLNPSVALTNNLFIPKIFYSSEDNNVLTVMKPFSFFYYKGSLSFPPCSEETINFVASMPIKLSTTSIQLFQEALKVQHFLLPDGSIEINDLLPISNRNIQPLNNRKVFHYNHEAYCEPNPKPKPIIPEGHYEKIIKKTIKYFYVDKESPSGISGSFVIDEEEAKGINKEIDLK